MQYTFAPALPDPMVFPGGVPALMDLTTAPEWLVAATTDEADRAAVAAVVRVVGAVALWRAWRSAGSDAPTRVYVLEVGAPDEALEPVTRALVDAGVPDPQVEAYATGTAPPPDQQRARNAAALLWAPQAVTAVELARVFDTVDPVGGPGFAPDHERLQGAGNRRVLRYLDSGHPVLDTTQRMIDVMEPARGAVVPMNYRTDGQWIWPDTVSYYLRGYDLAPDAGLLAHIRRRDHVMPKVGTVALHRALAELLRPVDETPVSDPHLSPRANR